ncbi:hypothetical protein DUNSADRAFT_9363 [Dunaliella salina]|uniref:Uncharacterized protein n=1 Tax=Dunaliella salina TaxID=3046 RepID=A0ABQ7H5H4_DUNSA|nr:hypothetical protein DUNSADRAFT_9363 [Dunaliella salina]|eukprot:KAF5842103.1 hypothetical protein DUNSADRAFT_9363 [Dunaliella salina]
MCFDGFECTIQLCIFQFMPYIIILNSTPEQKVRLVDRPEAIVRLSLRPLYHSDFHRY